MRIRTSFFFPHHIILFPPTTVLVILHELASKVSKNSNFGVHVDPSALRGMQTLARTFCKNCVLHYTNVTSRWTQYDSYILPSWLVGLVTANFGAVMDI